MSTNDLSFEWDDEKNKLNQERHGISFEVARFVFNDPGKVILPDLFHSGEEERGIAIGMVNKVLFVVYTERGKTIRLISARSATKAEKEIYHENNINA
ncbi:MAG: BrnT family toxin [Treponema sp.]|nr:BrnT family toxin [Treponema sp.]